jgi:hypothetical protein
MYENMFYGKYVSKLRTKLYTELYVTICNRLFFVASKP